MYPDFSYIAHDLFNTPYDNFLSVFKTFGVFLLLAIFGAGYVFRRECYHLYQKGIFKPYLVQFTSYVKPSTMDWVSSGIIGFFLGFKIPYILANKLAFQVDPAQVVFSMKGNWLAGFLGAGLLFGYRWWEDQRQRKKEVLVNTREMFPHDYMMDITILAGVSGIIGSKLFSVLEDPIGFFKDPLGQFFSGQGLNVYGGLILGFIMVSRFLIKRGYPLLPLMDAAAPAMITGYGLGRIACQLSGDGDWGIANTNSPPSWWIFPDWAWAWDYPHNILNEGVPILKECHYNPALKICENCIWHYCHKLEPMVYPTPIWEVAFCVIILGILYLLKPRLKMAGMLFFVYAFLTGFERYWIEKIRVNQRFDLPFGVHMTQAEVISVLAMILGVIGFIWCWKRGNKHLEAG